MFEHSEPEPESQDDFEAAATPRGLSQASGVDLGDEEPNDQENELISDEEEMEAEQHETHEDDGYLEDL